jgi:hypothetical protein
MMQKRAIRPHHPPARRLVEDGGRHARRELDVTPQIEAIGDVVRVAEQLGL